MPIHPEIVRRTDYLLSAILQRLGILLAHIGAPDTIADVTPLTDDYLEELSRWSIAKANAIREAADTGNA